MSEGAGGAMRRERRRQVSLRDFSSGESRLLVMCLRRSTGRVMRDAEDAMLEGNGHNGLESSKRSQQMVFKRFSRKGEVCKALRADWTS